MPYFQQRYGSPSLTSLLKHRGVSCLVNTLKVTHTSDVCPSRRCSTSVLYFKILPATDRAAPSTHLTVIKLSTVFLLEHLSEIIYDVKSLLAVRGAERKRSLSLEDIQERAQKVLGRFFIFVVMKKF